MKETLNTGSVTDYKTEWGGKETPPPPPSQNSPSNFPLTSPPDNYSVLFFYDSHDGHADKDLKREKQRWIQDL